MLFRSMPEIEYKAFAEYEEMADKHEYVHKIKTTKSDKKSIAKTLAVYSAFTEGLQLFSSFAILLNFPRFGKMKGMGQIVTYSIRSEERRVGKEWRSRVGPSAIKKRRELES